MPTKEKISAVKKVLEGISVSSVASEAGVARKTIYSWLNIYKAAAKRNKKTCLLPKYVAGRAHPREYTHTLEQKTVRLIKKDPTLSVSKMAERLNAGHHAVYNLLKALKLNTEDSRLAYSRIYSYPGIFDPQIKESVARKIVNSEGKVTDISRELRVSRKTIYKWLKEYKEKGTVRNNYLKGFEHPRSLGPEAEASVLSQVVKAPELSIHALATGLNFSNHAVFNILKRNFLTQRNARIIYSQAQAIRVSEKPEAIGFIDRIKSVFETFTPNLAPAPPPGGKSKFSPLLKISLASIIVLPLFTLALVYWVNLLRSGAAGNVVGLIFATISLIMGTFFFLYSLKYYFTVALVLSRTQQEGSKSRTSIGLEPNLDHVILTKKPYISVHIPFYNEKNVVERAIEASTNFDYPEYEVILCDDSTDETTTIIRDYQKKYLSKGESLKITTNSQDGWELSHVDVRPGVTLKHLHRISREGYKGGALRLALTQTDPRAEFVSVFDADFVPYPDSLNLFLKYFKAENNMSEDYTVSKVAAVQGYQWHVLNKSENWITRGVRSEYAGSYVIERAGTEIYGGLKQISGSVYMIRRKPLEEVGWATSITEDFELTLKLYNAGYKVVYTPYIQAPAECVSTLRRLVRQRMRWAEGHSFNVKKMFAKLMFSPKLSSAEKFETVYLAPYYLQAFFFVVGTLSWFISETLLPARLPFWTELWGWSLVLTNMVALPLMNTVGMFLEESEQKDYTGILSFVALSYLVVPFQAYAAVKGFLETSEGPWFRTPKTGRITDVFARGKFYRLIRQILPRRATSFQSTYSYNYITLTTANNRFSNFKIKRSGNKYISKALLTGLTIIILLLNQLSFFAPGVLAASPNPTIEQQINFMDKLYSTTSTSAAPGDNSLGMFTWNDSKYNNATVNMDYDAGKSGNLSYGLTSVGLSLVNGTTYTPAIRYQCLAVSGIATEYAIPGLYTSGGVLVQFSEVSISLGEVPGGKCPTSANRTPAYIAAARLRIVQTNATGITNTRNMIELGDGETISTGTTATQLTYPKYWLYTSGNYDGTVTTTFEATVWRAGGSSYTAYVCLYSTAGSEIGCVSTTSTSPAYPTAVSVTLSNGTEYEVRVKASAAAKTVYIANAKVIVDQAAAGGITKLETVQHYNNTLATESTSSYVSKQFLTEFVLDNWYGGTFAAYFESDIKTNNSSNAYYARLYDIYNATPMGEITGNDTSYVRKTSSDIWSSLAAGGNTMIDVQLKNNSTSTTSSSNSWLIIKVTNLQVPEKLIFALPLISLIPIIIKKRKEILLNRNG